ncbi:Mitogen-activated protein kinase scaffold protein [Echinococcus granulosus]|uniref:Mitogen-activated protein kinase scaffold protein n=1 Tax=Echinococcus granulosus TaxID=6210 RepID=W6U8B1_ECHGR|nr:Mitogen-activated protein kinase scaffold protein [Echinococcus granulosus]EUB57415.1 Mitogen-activated protein kinase scaffold protein [Echinococcus granulosus]
MRQGVWYIPYLMISSQLTNIFAATFHRNAVDGIVGIYVSDKDGARMVGVSIEDAPEQAFMTYVVTSFIASVQQLPKLGFGEVQHMITKYQNMTICQFVYAPNESTPPVYLTAVGTNACDLGALTSLEVPLRPLLGVLASRAAERFEQEAMLTRTDAGGHFYRILRTDAT